MKRLVIVRVSGMVGGCALRYALEHNRLRRTILLSGHPMADY